MKTVKELLTERTSIRRYTREKLDGGELDFIYEAIRNSPTSYNGQQFSVIAVTDPEEKELLYEVIGQKQIKTCGVFLVFCADYYKIKVAAEAIGQPYPEFSDTMDGIMVGIIDAALAMQTAYIAALSIGLGGCCIGYARTANPNRVADILHLPEGVFVVCGLALGFPAESPDLKPKQPLSLLIHPNHYRNDDMEADLLEYDKTVSEYNRTRSGTTTQNDWISHMLGYYEEGLTYHIEGYLENQGFKLRL
ncbi:MAG: nitroreductase family protein [Coprobacter sp.]|nr:nitroreductase family protein [Coprobacter sp.]